MYILFCLVTLFACVLGTICGMGGGVIIKPVLDAAQVMRVSSVNFISGIVVIGMTIWSVGKSLIKKESVLQFDVTVYLAVSAAVGGLFGKQLFQIVAGLFENPNTAAGVQGICLFLATLATLIYTVRKEQIKSMHVNSIWIRILIGLGLGIFGAFLGIGGGPFNVAILCYFFSMETKVATQNSLLIILFSQAASTAKAAAGGVDKVPVLLLICMVLTGVAGSEIGRRCNKRLNNRQAAWCLEGAMVLIMGISCWNVYQYLVC
ncbi:MAG: sulfite exporter TauE/SafE family protein [Lachnospiraceae bacterium]|nr:sulfite exporter TauE/SafE family protein [Lachnospiraceae bacterium]MDD3615703.1 sulfite exporter TauE/SafE family protein [Lachnospiraceae bacterium]